MKILASSENTILVRFRMFIQGEELEPRIIREFLQSRDSWFLLAPNAEVQEHARRVLVRLYYIKGGDDRTQESVDYQVGRVLDAGRSIVHQLRRVADDIERKIERATTRDAVTRLGYEIVNTTMWGVANAGLDAPMFNLIELQKTEAFFDNNKIPEA